MIRKQKKRLKSIQIVFEVNRYGISGRKRTEINRDCFENAKRETETHAHARTRASGYAAAAAACDRCRARGRERGEAKGKESLRGSGAVALTRWKETPSSLPRIDR